MLSTGSMMESKELGLLVTKVRDVSCGGLKIMMKIGGVGIIVKEQLCKKVKQV